MGTKILTTRFQQTQTSDEVVQIDFSKYVLNAESKNIQVYDVVTPEREITPIKGKNSHASPFYKPLGVNVVIH